MSRIREFLLIKKKKKKKKRGGEQKMSTCVITGSMWAMHLFHFCYACDVDQTLLISVVNFVIDSPVHLPYTDSESDTLTALLVF